MHNETLQLNIEPGLFEWGNWFKAGPPSWIPPAEVRKKNGAYFRIPILAKKY